MRCDDRTVKIKSAWKLMMIIPYHLLTLSPHRNKIFRLLCIFFAARLPNMPACFRWLFFFVDIRWVVGSTRLCRKVFFEKGNNLPNIILYTFIFFSLFCNYDCDYDYDYDYNYFVFFYDNLYHLLNMRCVYYSGIVYRIPECYIKHDGYL